MDLHDQLCLELDDAKLSALCGILPGMHTRSQLCGALHAPTGLVTCLLWNFFTASVILGRLCVGARGEGGGARGGRGALYSSKESVRGHKQRAVGQHDVKLPVQASPQAHSECGSRLRCWALPVVPVRQRGRRNQFQQFLLMLACAVGLTGAAWPQAQCVNQAS